MRPLALPLVLAACAPAPSADTAFTLGAYTVSVDGAVLRVDGPAGPILDDARLAVGGGTQTIEVATGSFRFRDIDETLTEATAWSATAVGGGVVLDAFANGARLATVVVTPREGRLHLDVRPAADAVRDTPRVRLTAACDTDEHVLGLGGHAYDVDHVGHAFPLWVSEPGIGKSPSNNVEETGFPLEGTRHAASYPTPFLLRPQHPSGIVVDTTARVDVDLCATDPARLSLTPWDAEPAFVLLSGERPVDVARAFSDFNGRPPLAPLWAFAPWVTAVRGEARVREAVDTLRSRAIPTGVIWTEDWKGADLLATGFRLSEEWFTDGAFYPDLPALDAFLEARGFKWLGYFAPFVGRGDETANDAIEAGAVIRSPDGRSPYWFTGVRFTDVTMVDLSTTSSQRWAAGYLDALRDAGMDGWMVDYAEWLPTDAVLASGEDALFVHNDYPRRWQAATARSLSFDEHVWFCRSGWLRAAPACPVAWLGDQRTSFDADDGLPSILPMGIGTALAGAPIVTHDVAGYQSVGNPPSDREVWTRWASLGAFTAILRTHHGSFKDQNHQYDTDEPTLDHWKHVTTEHMRILPYRRGISARAVADGTPSLQPVAFVADAPWDRKDAWMLGDALLVAPIVERGVQERAVDLPGPVRWLDHWTEAVVTSGVFPAPFPSTSDDPLLPVFQREGTVVPMLVTIPETLLDLDGDDEDDGIVDGPEADVARRVRVFGAGGTFTEADGTTYTVVGAPSAAASVTVEITSGPVDVGGATVQITGTVARSYEIVVIP